MSKAALSIEQMKHLTELGLDTSDAKMWYYGEANSDGKLYWKNITSNCYCSNPIPTYTLQDILDKLPESITYHDNRFELRISKKRIIYYSEDGLVPIDNLSGYVTHTMMSIENENLIDAAYDILCQLIQCEFIKKNKKE